MKYILSIISILFFQQLSAQSTEYEISGKLISEDTKDPIESATIYLERKKDSTLVSYTITDVKGNFSLEGKTKDTDLIFKVSSLGYKAIIKK